VLSAYVSVVDSHQRPIDGLGAGDFVVRVDGTDASVVDARRATTPIALAITIDTDIRDALAAREALRAVIDRVRDELGTSRVGLTRYDFGVTLDDVALAAGSLITQFDRQSTDGVELLPGVIGSAKILAAEASDRRAVLAISRADWVNPLQEGPFAKDVIGALRQSHSSFWSVAITPPNDRGDTMSEQIISLSSLMTGGRVEAILDKAALKPAVDRMITTVIAQYVLTYRLPANFSKGDLRVGVRRDGASVRAPAWAK